MAAQAITTRRVAPPLEHRILVTATLCLLAFGAVMVYSASSPSGVVNGHGDGTSEFFMYLLAGAVGLIAMRVCEHRGLSLLSAPVVRLGLLGSFALLVAVLAPGIGVDVNGARRWIGAGPLQFQPSEVMKIALVLYVARYIADHPRRLHRGFKEAIAPIAVVVAPACLLMYVEPDLGTTLIVCATVLALLVAGGVPMRYVMILLATAAALVLMLMLGSHYQRERLLSFLNPSACAQGTCWQYHQGQLAIGSGGLFGDGLGHSVGKDGWLPEAQTDFILAVVGEELGVAGILGLLCLYGMIAYAGLRTARRAKSPYEKLLASGLTSLILCQGLINIFVVLGLAPLTGVPLPFMSYAPTNLCVMLASIGLLLNIARPSARSLRAVDDRGGPRTAVAREAAADRDRSRRDRGARGPGAGGRRRAAS